MSTKKTAKSKAAPKRKRTVPAKKSAVPAHDAALQVGTSGPVEFEPKELLRLSDNIAMPVQLVIKNLGPGTVGFFAGYGDHNGSGARQVRVTYRLCAKSPLRTRRKNRVLCSKSIFSGAFQVSGRVSSR